MYNIHGSLRAYTLYIRGGLMHFKATHTHSCQTFNILCTVFFLPRVTVVAICGLPKERLKQYMLGFSTVKTNVVQVAGSGLCHLVTERTFWKASATFHERSGGQWLNSFIHSASGLNFTFTGPFPSKLFSPQDPASANTDRVLTGTSLQAQ